jgi:hypothetical protein
VEGKEREGKRKFQGILVERGVGGSWGACCAHGAQMQPCGSDHVSRLQLPTLGGILPWYYQDFHIGILRKKRTCLMEVFIADAEKKLAAKGQC